MAEERAATADPPQLGSPYVLHLDDSFGIQRLGIFAVSQDTHVPLRKIPIYAEAVIYEIQTPPREHPNSVWRAQLRQAVANLPADDQERVTKAVEQRVSADWLAVTHRATHFFQLLTRNLTSAFEDDPAEDGRAAIISRVVDGLASEMNATRPSAQQSNDAYRLFPLGLLGTDHVGFVSFDVSRVELSTVAAQMTRHALREAPKYGVAFKIYPNLVQTNHVLVPDVNTAISSKAVVARLQLDPKTIKSVMSLSLPSIQDPSLIEWQLSPGSFASVPQDLVGSNGCESLTPANFAISQYRLVQVQRVQLTGSENADSALREFSAFPPVIIAEYSVRVIPVGHSLGQILYSLPLAPGESARLAVIDWRRQDAGERKEDTKMTEALLHDQTRDRTVQETVQAALDEWQRGGSVMGGVSGGGGASGSTGMMGASGGAMMSAGGAYTTSSGTRDLSVDTVQKVVDAIHQASSATRELQSTVIVQTDQLEKESIQTKAFANYNRGHTLTILYYEVLRHHRLVVSLDRVRLGIAVKRTMFPWAAPPSFDPFANILNSAMWPPYYYNDSAMLLSKRYVLQPALLDQSLAPAFDSVVKLHQQETKIAITPNPSPDATIKFTSFLVTLGVSTPTDDLQQVRLLLKDGDQHGLILSFRGGLVNINGNKELNSEGQHTFTSDAANPGYEWQNIIAFRIINNDQDEELLGINAIGVTGYYAGGTKDLIPMKSGSWQTNKLYSYFDVPVNQPTPIGPVMTAEQSISVEDASAVRTLRQHLQYENGYYRRILDLSIPMAHYAMAFETIPAFPGDTSPTPKTLINIASPTPVETLGDMIVFPRLDSKGDDEVRELYKDPVPPQERLITMPSRGVFAEAKLGHCNVAEEIDETRFWRWDQHPLPLLAPEIQPIEAKKPEDNKVNVDKSELPPSVVNIQTPQALPDPTGAGPALTALMTANAFRDMSGAKEVQAMLKDLTEGAVSMAQAANKAFETGQKGSNDKNQQNLDHEADMARISSGDKKADITNDQVKAQQQTPSDTQQGLKVIENQADKGNITPDKKRDLINNHLDNMAGSKPTPPIVPTPKDPLRTRTLTVSVYGQQGSVSGRYAVTLWQGPDSVGFQQSTAQDQTKITVQYTPKVDRAFLLVDIQGEIISSQGRQLDAGFQIDKGNNVDVDIPLDVWKDYEDAYLFLDLIVEKTTVTAKTTEEAINKLQVAAQADANLGMLLGGVGGSLAKLLGKVAKILPGINLDVKWEWAPGDANKTVATEIPMVIVFYTGGVKKRDTSPVK